MVTPNGRTLEAGDAAVATKTAGVTVYLMEELGDARMRCDQLLRYIEKASQLIEKSSQKDHLFEVAGDLIRGVPESAFKLHKALQAVALAASRLDYEEIKQDLRPEKVDELERVLKDVRVRQVQRRSLPMINPGKVVQELRSLAKQARESGRLDTGGLSGLIAALEADAPKVAREAQDQAATHLEAMAHALENPPAGEQPSRFRLAQVLRRTLAAHIEVSSGEETAKQAQGFETRASIDPVPRDPAEVNQALADFIKYARLVDSTGGSGDYKRMLGNLIGVLNSAYHITRIFDMEGTGYIARAVKAIMPYTNLRPMANFASVRASKDDDGEDEKFEKEAASRAPDALFKRMKEAVDGLLEARKKIRNVHEDLSDIASDATGTVFTNNYRNPEIDTVSKDLYELDRTMGQAFRDIERLEKTMRSTMIKSAAESDDKRSRYEEGKSADPTENMSDADAKEWKANTEEYGGKFKSASEDERRSRYEEGESADPTENMSDADAKEWKSNTEEHKDKFKKEAGGVEIKTPDLETVKAIGRGKGHFGIEYWVQGPSGAKNVVNERGAGGHPREKFRYKLRNEYDVPSRRVDELVKELDAKAGDKRAADDAWKVA